MTTEKLTFIMTDFKNLTQYLEQYPITRKQQNLSGFFQKLEEAEILSDDDDGWDLVKVNCKVHIRELHTSLNYAYTVVMPEHADHKKCRVSVFSSIGNALLGRRMGDEVVWKTAAGTRRFLIMKVSAVNKEPEARFSS